MTKEEVLSLVRKYNEQKCTNEEASLLETWYVKRNTLHHQELSLEKIENDLEEIFHALPKEKVSIPLWKKIAVASMVLIVSLLGLYYVSERAVHQQDVGNLKRYQAVLVPGGNHATLTLADGQVINLMDVSKGMLTKESGIIVSKTADGQLVYTAAENGTTLSGYNTLNTPKGGQYLVILPDGSRVWLNAASELKFPLHFDKDRRSVLLKGEAYFEIAKDVKRPFFVNTVQQQVKVLGTHFNVNAYADEPGTRTTLLEGAILVTATSNVSNKNSPPKQILLKPNEQVVLKEDFKLSRINSASEISWINGKFVFNDEPLESILRKVSRWYNLEIQYADPETRHETFGGTMSRFDSASKVLGKLEAIGEVWFEIEKTGNKDNKGFKVIVHKK